MECGLGCERIRGKVEPSFAENEDGVLVQEILLEKGKWESTRDQWLSAMGFPPFLGLADQ